MQSYNIHIIIQILNVEQNNKGSQKYLTFLESDIITFPRLDKDLFIALASVSLLPADPESFTRSLPAKSTRFRIPNNEKLASIYS